MSPRQRRRHRRSGSLAGKLILLASAVIGMLALAVTAAGGWVLGMASDAPDPDTLRPLTKGQNSLVYAGDGSMLGYIRSDQIRQPVRYREIPQVMRNAAVAIEDQRFYEHSGVDVGGAVRALYENITAREVVQGGSTITMQLMRNLFIANPDQDIDRKIKEAAMAMDYEQSHNKAQILTQYLNTASFGTLDGMTAVGVQAASRLYFSRSVWDLTLPQAALLAGLPQAPTSHNPVLNPRGAMERRNEVLAQMAEQGYVPQERALRAQAAGLQLNPTGAYSSVREPLFFDYVESELIDEYGVNTVRQGGLEIHTTIDPDLQEAGRAAIEEHLYLSDDPSAAIVVIDPQTGAVKAMVSSASYAESKYNFAVQGRRQPGSTFKTFVLSTAIKQGIDPDSTYYTSKPLDLELPEYGSWEVTTYSESYAGSTSITSATLSSDNTVYAQLALDVGPEEVAHTAHQMGITTELDGLPAEGLGGLRIGVSPIEMASAYATLAAGGIHRPPVAIRRVEFPNGRVDHPQAEEPRRVLTEAEAYAVTDILNQNMTGGTGTAAYTGCSGQAGKTGTTDRFTDAWFVGYQPNAAISVWVGHPESNAVEMRNVHGISVAGGTFPAEIWNSFYHEAGISCESPEAPPESPDWIPYTGGYTTGPFDEDGSDFEDGSDSGDGDSAFQEESGESEETGGQGEQFDSDAYAPGVGQDPVEVDPPPSSGNPGGGGGNQGTPGGGGGGTDPGGGFSP